MTAHDLAKRLRTYADSDRWRAHDGRFRLDLRIAADALDRAEAASVEFGRRLDKVESQRDAALALAEEFRESRSEARRVAEEFRDNFAEANPDQPRIPLPWEGN